VKTAAIHVSASPQARYNLDEIKADALWLSQKATIDEISALRIVVLEWQSRPATQLLAGFAEEEVMSLLNATGIDDFRTSMTGPQIMDVLNKRISNDRDALGFSSEPARRLRLRHCYLSERSHIVKISRKLLSLSLHDDIPNGGMRISTRNTGKDHTKTNKSLRDLGSVIFRDSATEDGRVRFLQACIKAIRHRVDQFQTDGGWLGTTDADEECEIFWRITVIEEIVHIMQILFLQLQASANIPTAGLLLSWLRLLTDSGFLESLFVVSVICSPVLLRWTITLINVM
jgi:nuclear pore complex protein Nup188